MDFELTEQQELFRKTVRDWVDREAPKEWARELEADEHAFPHVLWDKFSAAGFHGIGLPEEYGGQGGDVMTQMILARGLSRSLAGLTWVWGISSFAGGKSVGVYGTDEQKQRHLPAIAEGREKWAIGFTEPGGGTDVLGALRTRATKVDGGWVVNGQKTWSSMAHVADYILLLARTSDYAEKRHQGVSLLILPTRSEGVTIREIPKVGMRSLGSCDVYLDDVFVPDENLLGEQDKAWYMLLPTLNNERIMLSSFCVGIMDAVLEDAVRYAKEREAFGGPIGRFQAVQHHIANIAMWRDQAELMVNRAAWLQSLGRPCHQEATMAKVVASELGGQAADLGLQVLGGMGYSAETDMQRYWRDVRLFRIGPITNEMARNGIAEGLGLPRSFS
ncbi:acyl-CoA dehydrogenase [Actinomycetospora sp. NBRC 106375]|uniref:acyl-CoA dehydrogenase family protein n=1 Tax=Actinomycetospora sp. NBRC 106375 TaxID=3032207 RepID=UPI0024A50DE8|nr:acyl-CoA dehydrogenase family protein [Actinomycetospora sp. NBRC 106375]GLZ50187.1 acyl-CoA dehydrogenase [Actinomycetospora sp. NBRC 106375]